MDSGMTARLQPERVGALEQAPAGAAETASGVPEAAGSRVRAIGFSRDLPAPLVQALRSSGFAGLRIEGGAPAGDDAGKRWSDLSLVALDERADAERGLACLSEAAGLRLAVCLCSSEAMAVRAIAAGADGVLFLHDGHEDLANALQAAASGAPALTATAARALIAHARGEVRASRDAPVAKATQACRIDGDAPAPGMAVQVRLTAREREIIMLADQGCTFTQAARLMGVQVSTVYTHVRRLYEKLSVNSLPQALHEARRAGLL